MSWSVLRGLSPTAIHIESLRDSGTRPRARFRINHPPQRRRGSECMIPRPTNYRHRPSPAGTNMNSRGCQPTGWRPMTARRPPWPRAAPAICNWAVRNRPSDRAQLRQERNPCRNQDHRSSSPVVGGMLTGHHSSSSHSGTLANADQAASGAPVLLATPQSMKKHDTIDRPLHAPSAPRGCGATCGAIRTSRAIRSAH